MVKKIFTGLQLSFYFPIRRELDSFVNWENYSKETLSDSTANEAARAQTSSGANPLMSFVKG